jgi:hypothetical protein
MAKKKSNKIPKIKGSRSRKKEELPKDQKAFDALCEYSIRYELGTKWNQNPALTYRYMACKDCGQDTVAGMASISMVCSACVQEQVGPPDITSQRKSSGRPTGWHFMIEFVDKDGNVFHRGEEQPKLRGTLDPTIIEPKKRIRKKDKEAARSHASVQLHKLKKKLAKARFKKDQKPIMSEIKKLQRIALGKFPKKFVFEDFMSN